MNFLLCGPVRLAKAEVRHVPFLPILKGGFCKEYNMDVVLLVYVGRCCHKFFNKHASCECLLPLQKLLFDYAETGLIVLCFWPWITVNELGRQIGCFCDRVF